MESECIGTGTERPSGSDGGSSSSNIGLIVGIVVGVCAVIVIITIIVIVILARCRTNNKPINVDEDSTRNHYSSDPTASRLVTTRDESGSGLLDHLGPVSPLNLV